MPKIGPVPDDINADVDLKKHWSILDQTRAELIKSGRSGVIIYVDAEDAYQTKLAAFLKRFDTEMPQDNKPYLIIEHDTQADKLFARVLEFGLKAELIPAQR